MTPRRVRSTIGELPFASRDESIIAKKPRENQARRNEIMARTKSRHICRGEAGASERRPYQGGATDLHPALSSPLATPLRSGGYAGERRNYEEKRALWKVRQGTRDRVPN